MQTNTCACACASINERHEDLCPPASSVLVHPPMFQFPGKWRTMTESKKSKSFGAALQPATAPVQEGICAKEALKAVKMLYIILIDSLTTVLGFLVSIPYRGKLRSL